MHFIRIFTDRVGTHTACAGPTDEGPKSVLGSEKKFWVDKRQWQVPALEAGHSAECPSAAGPG